GATWLEEEIVRVGDVAIVGSIAWYDYSAVDPGITLSPDDIGKMKHHLNNDSTWIDWERDDREFAAERGAALGERLKEAARDPKVRAILVVTHVPILEEQIERRPKDQLWGVSNAYFGNLTLGAALIGEPKVSAVVSGHTHFGRSHVRAR